ncbi:MAG: esterase/lipase family protein [Bradymonadia bacterium]
MSVNVFLVPGFFGFSQFGDIDYFHRVEEILTEALKARGVEAIVQQTSTQPTGSIRSRADTLIDEIFEKGGREGSLHLIGHSTGGLDIRLLATPGVQLRPGDDEEEIGARLKSVISVCTPHFGTPLARFFTTLQGRHILRTMAALATSGKGRSGIVMGIQALRTIARLDDRIGLERNFLDRLVERALGSISTRKDDPFFGFLEDISEDQGAVIQLTPEGTDLFNAAVTDRPGVDYRCVLAAAPPEGAEQLKRRYHPAQIALFKVFRLMYTLTAKAPKSYPYPSPTMGANPEWAQSLPFELDSASNDGVVPTLSQLYGRPITAVVGDHLDVVGQFTWGGGDPFTDWLPSGSNFDEARFTGLWNSVADAIVEAELRQSVPEVAAKAAPVEAVAEEAPKPAAKRPAPRKATAKKAPAAKTAPKKPAPAKAGAKASAKKPASTARARTGKSAAAKSAAAKASATKSSTTKSATAKAGAKKAAAKPAAKTAPKKPRRAAARPKAPAHSEQPPVEATAETTAETTTKAEATVAAETTTSAEQA